MAWNLSIGRTTGYAGNRIRIEVLNILRLAIPTVLGLVSTVAMGAIDTAMLAPLGHNVVAAIGLATSAFIFVNSALIGFMSVVGVHIAQTVGSGSMMQTSFAVTNGLFLAAILSLFAALGMVLIMPVLSLIAPEAAIYELASSYWLILAGASIPHTFLAAFRAIYIALNRPWTALAFTLVGIGLNIPLNLVLIHGGPGFEGWGIVGAGLASLIAKTVTLGIFVFHLQRSRSLSGFTGRSSVSLKAILAQLRDGFPVALGSAAEGGAYAMTGFLYGLLGIVALAAHQVVHSVGVIFYMVPIGMMIASSIRTAQLIGASRSHEVFFVLIAANLIAVSWSVFVVVLVTVFRGPVTSALSPSEDVAALAMTLFLAMAFIQFADCIQSNVLGVLRGMSDNLVPNAITITSYWFLGLPLAALLGFSSGLGAAGIALGYGIVVLGVALLLHARLFGKS